MTDLRFSFRLVHHKIGFYCSSKIKYFEVKILSFLTLEINTLDVVQYIMSICICVCIFIDKEVADRQRKIELRNSIDRSNVNLNWKDGISLGFHSYMFLYPEKKM